MLSSEEKTPYSGTVSNFLTSSKEPNKLRIPINTQFLTQIKLDSAKSFPTMLYPDQPEIKIAYADVNNQEQIDLLVNYAPQGNITSPHPQVIFIVRGDYHVENLGYTRSNPRNWPTWMEFHINAQHFRKLVNPIIKTEELLRK